MTILIYQNIAIQIYQKILYVSIDKNKKTVLNIRRKLQKYISFV